MRIAVILFILVGLIGCGREREPADATSTPSATGADAAVSSDAAAADPMPTRVSPSDTCADAPELPAAEPGRWRAVFSSYQEAALDYGAACRRAFGTPPVDLAFRWTPQTSGTARARLASDEMGFTPALAVHTSVTCDDASRVTCEDYDHRDGYVTVEFEAEAGVPIYIVLIDALPEWADGDAAIVVGMVRPSGA